MKKLIAITVSLTMAFSALPVSAREAEVPKNTKEETVYVMAGTDGDVNNIIVSDRIVNNEGKNVIRDVSHLTDIENVKGDETFTASGENLEWKAGGNDIFYQGNSDKETPIDMKVTYFLDGKAVSGEHLAGKSGKVTIRYDYTNKETVEVEVDGKQKEMYVPFAVITGMILDSSIFTNVEVTNGKVLSDGENTVVVGLALPGLNKDLELSGNNLFSFLEEENEEDITVPEYVEVTADVTDFALSNTVTIATNEVFNRVDAKTDDIREKIDDMLDQLTDAMKQLMDGSDQLYDGLDTLLAGSGDLVSGVAKLTGGATKLKKGADGLDSGARRIKSGLKSLSDGLKLLKNNNEKLNNGARTVFESLLDSANTQLTAAGLQVDKLTISNFDDVLEKVIESLDEKKVYAQAKESVTKAIEDMGDALYKKYIESNADTFYTAYILGIQDQVYAAYIDSHFQEIAVETLKETGQDADIYQQAIASNPAAFKLDFTDKTPEEIQDMIIEKIGQLSEEDKNGILAAAVAGFDDDTKADIRKGALASLTKDQKALIRAGAIASLTEDEKKQIREGALTQLTKEQKAQIKEGAIDQQMASPEVQAKLKEASEAVKQLAALKASLDSYKAFYQGILTYTDSVSAAYKGSKELYDGADALQDGTDALKEGAKALRDGLLELNSKLPDLRDGVKQLRDGSKQLADGLKQLNEEGIEKLVDKVGSIEKLADRLDSMVHVSKSYTTFSGKAAGMDGNVKFVIRTDAIE